MGIASWCSWIRPLSFGVVVTAKKNYNFITFHDILMFIVVTSLFSTLPSLTPLELGTGLAPWPVRKLRREGSSKMGFGCLSSGQKNPSFWENTGFNSFWQFLWQKYERHPPASSNMKWNMAGGVGNSISLMEYNLSKPFEPDVNLDFPMSG